MLLLCFCLPASAFAESMVGDGGDFGPDRSAPPLPPDSGPDGGEGDPPLDDSGTSLVIDLGVEDTGEQGPVIDSGQGVPIDLGVRDSDVVAPPDADLPDQGFMDSSAAATDSGARELGTAKAECGCNDTADRSSPAIVFAMLVALFALRRSAHF